MKIDIDWVNDMDAERKIDELCSKNEDVELNILKNGMVNYVEDDIGALDGCRSDDITRKQLWGYYANYEANELAATDGRVLAFCKNQDFNGLKKQYDKSPILAPMTSKQRAFFNRVCKLHDEDVDEAVEHIKNMEFETPEWNEAQKIGMVNFFDDGKYVWYKWNPYAIVDGIYPDYHRVIDPDEKYDGGMKIEINDGIRNAVYNGLAFCKSIKDRGCQRCLFCIDIETGEWKVLVNNFNAPKYMCLNLEVSMKKMLKLMPNGAKMMLQNDPLKPIKCETNDRLFMAMPCRA